MRSVRARVFALLAALVLLLPSGAWARSQYYCRMMGGLVPSCCCGADARSQSAKHAQELQDANCCQRISPSTRSVLLSTPEAVRELALPATLAVVCVSADITPQPDTGTSCTESTQAPLAIGPPLFVMHCALLS